jgi:hypothetical protein
MTANIRHGNAKPCVLDAVANTHKSKPGTRAKAAKAAKVSERKMKRARKVRKASPTVAAKVNELRKVARAEYVREFSVRFREGIVPDADSAQFIEEISSSLGWPEGPFVRNEKDPEPPRYASPEAEAQAILTALLSACACLGVLRALAADGDENALSELVQQLPGNIRWLEGYSYRDKGNLKAFATVANAWPVMLNLRPREQRQAAEYMERIGLDPKFDPDFYWPEPAGAAEVKNQEPPRFDNPADKGRAILYMSYSAGRRLEELRPYVADGNQLATVSFVLLLAENVAWLESYSVRDKGNLKATANRAPVWPVIMARCPRRTKAAAEYLKRIELGTKAQISSSPKWGTSWGNEGAVATHYAMGIRLAVGNARTFFQSYDKRLETDGPLFRAAWEKVPQWIKDAGKLAPLTKDSAPRWFEIGWHLLVEKHNGHPESDPTLGKLGSFRKLHSEHVGQQKTVTARTAESNIRDGIKQRIADALVSLAPPS